MALKPISATTLEEWEELVQYQIDKMTFRHIEVRHNVATVLINKLNITTLGRYRKINLIRKLELFLQFEEMTNNQQYRYLSSAGNAILSETNSSTKKRKIGQLEKKLRKSNIGRDRKNQLRKKYELQASPKPWTNRDHNEYESNLVRQWRNESDVQTTYGRNKPGGELKY